MMRSSLGMRRALMALLAGCALATAACQRKDDGTAQHRRDERSDMATPTPPNVEPPAATPKPVLVDSPSRGALITTPVRVTGKARGSWYFEAEFPIRILNARDEMIGTGIARAQGDWQTSDYVPFEASIVFRAPPEDTTGYLVIEKSNPSGLPQNAAESRVPVRFH